MIDNDRAANRFLEGIKTNMEAAASAQQPSSKTPVTAHVTINRAVGCTIIVGQPPEPIAQPRRRAARKA